MIKKYFSNILTIAFSKTAKNTYFVFIGNSLSLIFSFIYTVLLVRLLSLSDFGYYSAIFTFMLLISDISDIGIGSSLSRFLPPLKQEQDKLQSFLKTAFMLQLVISVFIAIIIFIFSSFIANVIFHNINLEILLKIISIGVIGAVITNFSIYSLAAKEKFISMSITTTSVGIFRVIFLVFLILLSQVFLYQVVIAQVLSYIFVAIFGMILVGPAFVFIHRTKGDLKRLLSFTSYLGIARILTSLSGKLDVIMLLALTNDPVSTGIYATASRLIAMYPIFSGSFSTVIAPKISTISDSLQLNKFLMKVILVTLVLISTIFFLIIFAHPFITILFGIKAIQAVPVFRLLLISMIFFVGSIPSVTLAIYYLKKPHILTVNSILQLIIVVGGNLFFIPIYGRFGACYSLIFAYGITLFLTSIMSYYYLTKRNVQK
ncbi:hypothetical protein COV53_04525 [Candidatus Gottesmanbacteria bacterium CG11_big_fil_rev_8_21_14_0_20_37_11]|uniref:Polysaccharide biosynthesis protein C-terminal domain-containing protein n=2 Tax=Candidatus Gottesmaniibacteriota TaxID=1752720 RepID=A0A2M7RPC3_9BACT|nr:MAG: hypothetical protein COX23_00960 [Candidatus Gottesmanbacteria bacterium CG23_combo_of_CG06-09_8_20_14_all_37_19]PIR08146.1 MAG: hypothetical protein COV53_04525 [Candidatus Gottesmanbacteria bacterium CG11_big_fil_rev_8_21_14_0_20_37_11]PIZ02177.1 MAG: hypothetical protein COY59_06145 [Candidatus Gottesmanbacteria bacterium CG_4_10_14_0_8_um_filter_37_24]